MPQINKNLWHNISMLFISHTVSIPVDEIQMHAMRAQGPGGQNVNKVSSAIHLRFDIRASSLPEFYKEKLLNLRDHHINKDGLIVIKAQQHRSQEKNRQLALQKLQALVRRAGIVPKKRCPTKPSQSARQKRMDSKHRRGKIKNLRNKSSIYND